MLEKLPDDEWRLLFGLARFGGLRVSSESHTLTWGGVDLKNRRMTVFAPKTGATRVVPIVPRLHALLTGAHAKREPEFEQVILLSKNNVHRTIAHAAERWQGQAGTRGPGVGETLHKMGRREVGAHAICGG